MRALFLALFLTGCTIQPNVDSPKVTVTLCLQVQPSTGVVSLVECDAGSSTKINLGTPDSAVPPTPEASEDAAPE